MIFLFCAALALYVVVGYPALLALRAYWRTRPVNKVRLDLGVTVLLPVHNGEAWIERKIQNLLALDYPRRFIEIIVVSDGSTDATDAIAARFPVQFIRIPKSGKAEAINCALQRARGEILFFTDVRQQLDSRALRYLVDCFSDPEVGVATGELTILDGQSREEANIGLYWKYEKWIRRKLSRIDSVLGATGCIYAMRRSLARPMPADTLLDDVHLPMQAFFAGYRIVMEEKASAYDTPTGLATEFRRKVRTQAGVYQLIGQFPALMGPGNRMWLDFVSYKFGRLMLPFLLLGMFWSAFFLPQPWGAVVVGVQVTFYVLAAANPWIPQESAMKRLSAPAAAFVVLVLAALCAVSILIVPPKRLWTPNGRR